MSMYPNILTPPTDDNSTPYLETLHVASEYASPNSNFPQTQYALDVNTGRLVQVQSPMLIDENSSDSYVPGAFMRIIEQPVDKFRFRYKSEMTGTHGSLNGMNNDKTRKVTYPTVELIGFTKPAVVRCSIYQINYKDRENMPHAHRLVRKLGSKEEVDDPHDIEIGPDNHFQAVFRNMGIIHTAKKNIVSELVKKKTKLKLEEIARVERRKRDLNTIEQVELEKDMENYVRYKLMKNVNIKLKPDVVPHKFECQNKKSVEIHQNRLSYLKTQHQQLITDAVETKKNPKKQKTDNDVVIVEGFSSNSENALNTSFSDVKGYSRIKGLADSESKSINLNVVCLRFDAFVDNNGILDPICKPVFTHGINNLKSALTGELKIVRMDHCTSPAKGGLEIFILVERVTKKNIKIRFFEVDDSDIEVWEDFGKFSDLDVHHQYAIVFKTPPYKDKNITTPVKVFIELLRPTDNSKSEPKEFTYVPSSKEYRLGSKRPRYNDSYSSSSLSSSEIPQTIEDVNLTNIFDNVLTSEELQKAAQNINSDEFKLLCKTQFFADYVQLESGGDVSASQHNNSLMVLDGTQQGTGNTSSDREMAHSAFSEITEMLKTKPSRQDILNMLNYHLSTDNKNNVLHVFVKQNQLKNVQILLYLISRVNRSLLNIRNIYGETPLTLAVTAMNVPMVKTLLHAGASILVSNSEGNTVLHQCVSSIPFSLDVCEALMSSADIDKCIDQENNDGDTPLKLAIDGKNITAVKLLCKNGADINKRHKKNGFTPLRMAVEAQDLDMVRFILQHKELDGTIPDFYGVAPLQAAEENKTIYKFMSEHLESADLENTDAMDIKSEVTSFSDEEMDQCIKTEDDTCDDMASLYDNVSRFTESCLDTVSSILDKSGNYKNLADLLELDHLLQLDAINSQSPSKVLLSHAETTDTIYNIRNFLENLDEVEAVQVIDNMVRNMNLNT